MYLLYNYHVLVDYPQWVREALLVAINHGLDTCMHDFTVAATKIWRLCPDAPPPAGFGDTVPASAFAKFKALVEEDGSKSYGAGQATGKRLRRKRPQQAAPNGKSPRAQAGQTGPYLRGPRTNGWEPNPHSENVCAKHKRRPAFVHICGAGNPAPACTAHLHSPTPRRMDLPRAGQLPPPRRGRLLPRRRLRKNSPAKQDRPSAAGARLSAAKVPGHRPSSAAAGTTRAKGGVGPPRAPWKGSRRQDLTGWALPAGGTDFGAGGEIHCLHGPGELRGSSQGPRTGFGLADPVQR